MSCFFKFYNSFDFRLRKLLRDDVFYSLTIIDITTKLLLKERGLSPVQIGRNT